MHSSLAVRDVQQAALAITWWTNAHAFRFSVPISSEPNPKSIRRHLSRAPLSTPYALTTMVQALVGSTVVAESSETVIVEGNHYFPPESIMVDLTSSDTT